MTSTIEVKEVPAVALIANVLVALVVAIHVYIVILEMFLWRTERGMQAFGTDQAFADRSAPLAANQGLYNGFLVAGLLWGLIAADPIGFQVKVFFLACVVVAGLYGAATVGRRILVVQALPAALALVAVVAAANMA
jgi:putative membrane protein